MWYCWSDGIFSGVLCRMQLSRAGTSNYITQILWDVVTSPALDTCIRHYIPHIPGQYTPYGKSELGHHWFKHLLVASWWANDDILPVNQEHVSTKSHSKCTFFRSSKRIKNLLSGCLIVHVSMCPQQLLTLTLCNINILVTLKNEFQQSATIQCEWSM